MKLSRQQKVKRLLLATLAATSLTWCGGVQAANITVGEGSEIHEQSVASKTLTLDNDNYTAAFAGMSTDNARENRLIINGGTYDAVSGGVVVYYGKEAAVQRFLSEVSGNYVEINGGTIGYVSGGEIAYAQVTGNGLSDDFFEGFTGNANGNKVVIKDGKIGSITSGGITSGGITGGGALRGSANGNVIEISGGEVSGNVIGGLVRGGTASEGFTASGNTISIWNSANLANANLIGGQVDGSPYYAGNTLYVYGAGNVVNRVDGFDKITFGVFDENRNNETFSIRVNGSTNIGNTLFDAVDVYADPNSGVTTNDKLNLLQSSGGINFSGSADAADTPTKIMHKGIDAAYELNNLQVNGSEISAEVGQKIFPVNVIPPPGIVPQIYPREIDTGFGDDNDNGESDSADDVKEVQEQHGFEIFFNTGGYKIKTDTGHGTWVRSSAGNYDLGFARSLETKSGKLYFAPVIEHGNGKFDAYLGKGQYYHQPVYGSGNSKYTAGGIIARKVNKNGFYFEASARGGKTESNFRSNDYVLSGNKTATGEYVPNEIGHVSYNVDAPVFIGHVRLGQAKRLNQNNLLDIYGVCFYTRQWGSDTDVHIANRDDEHLDFSAVNSMRFRLGYRLTTRTSRISRIYTGLAYQYEHTGSTFTVSNNGGMHGDGNKGSSGMIELGWQIKPSKTNPWLLDFNAQGWCGHQRGGSLMAKMQKSF